MRRDGEGTLEPNYGGIVLRSGDMIMEKGEFLSVS